MFYSGLDAELSLVILKLNVTNALSFIFDVDNVL